MVRDVFGREKRGKCDDDRELRVTDRRRIQLDDDPNAERDANVESPNLKPSYVEELEARAQAAEQKTLEVQARFEQLRKQLQSETDETRQRLNRAADERARREKADFIASLLPVLDNLERATEAADGGSSSEVIAEGIRQTAASFENALAAAGLEPIDAVGEMFDRSCTKRLKLSKWGSRMRARLLLNTRAATRLATGCCARRVLKLDAIQRRPVRNLRRRTARSSSFSLFEI